MIHHSTSKMPAHSISTGRYVHKETGIAEREFDLCTDKGLILDIQSIYCSEEGPLSRTALEEAAEESIETHLKPRTTYILLKARLLPPLSVCKLNTYGYCECSLRVWFPVHRCRVLEAVKTFV
jgi:hypothetical protein